MLSLILTEQEFIFSIPIEKKINFELFRIDKNTVPHKAFQSEVNCRLYMNTSQIIFG